MVYLTQAQEYAGYAAEGFQGCDRMEEDDMFYQPHEEAEGEEVGHDEDVEADYLVADDIVSKAQPKPESRRRRRGPLIPSCPVVGPPFPGGPETTILLSSYARHVEIPLWVNHHNVSV